MPELPEVETVRCGLEPALINARILDCECRRDAIRDPIPPEFSVRCTEATVIAVRRRGKYLLIDMHNGYSIILHLGMSGKLIYVPGGIDTPYEPAKHDHIIWTTENGRLIFNDPRRFGRADIAETSGLPEVPYLKRLGPEPLDGNWRPEDFFLMLKGTSRPVKNAIMDAGIVVGVGNIYASESLYTAGIHPERVSKSITETEAHKLHQSIIVTLEAAIFSGGSTLRDFVRSSGESGYFQHSFNVYGKTGEPCMECALPIKKSVMAGRSTFFCAHCQQ